jgi:hypothetical protein
VTTAGRQRSSPWREEKAERGESIFSRTRAGRERHLSAVQEP